MAQAATTDPSGPNNDVGKPRLQTAGVDRLSQVQLVAACARAHDPVDAIVGVAGQQHAHDA